jgi:hypothetical protein
LSESLIFGILLNKPVGHIPPVTITKADPLNEIYHYVDTYFFETMNDEGQFQSINIQERLSKLSNLEFDSKSSQDQEEI